MKIIRGLFALLVAVTIGLALVSTTAAGAHAQGGVPPKLPGLEELMRMTLGAVGALVVTGLLTYYWGYFVSAIAARVPFDVPSWVWDALIVVPTAGIAGAWNAFASFMSAAFPGIMDMTVASALLYVANWLFSLFMSRRGGLANLAHIGDVARVRVFGQEFDVNVQARRARSGVLLFE